MSDGVKGVRPCCLPCTDVLWAERAIGRNPTSVLVSDAIVADIMDNAGCETGAVADVMMDSTQQWRRIACSGISDMRGLTLRSS